jgi:anti-sigma B factor antagonist
MTQTPVRSLRSSPPAPPSPFRCTRSPGRLGAAWFHLTGELDLAGAPILAEQLWEAQASSYLVVVDLRGLDFIDCAGLGVLVAVDAQARRTRRSLVLVRGGGQVGRMLELTGLLEELEVVDLHAQQILRPVLGATVKARPEDPRRSDLRLER